jgi:Helix-turn-helix domain
MQVVKGMALMAKLDINFDTIETLLTVSETARLLKMSPAFVRKFADEIGAVRLGGSPRRSGRLRFPVSRVKRYIEDNIRKK